MTSIIHDFTTFRPWRTLNETSVVNIPWSGSQRFLQSPGMLREDLCCSELLPPRLGPQQEQGAGDWQHTRGQTFSSQKSFHWCILRLPMITILRSWYTQSVLERKWGHQHVVLAVLPLPLCWLRWNSTSRLGTGKLGRVKPRQTCQQDCCTPLCGNSAQVKCPFGTAVKDEDVNKTSDGTDEARIAGMCWIFGYTVCPRINSCPPTCKTCNGRITICIAIVIQKVVIQFIEL